LQASATPASRSTLLSGQGGTAKFTDPAQATAALGQIPQEEALADLNSVVAELQRRAPGKKVAASDSAWVAASFGGCWPQVRRSWRPPSPFMGRHRTIRTSQ